MTREEFESILEEAFLEGYNDAMEEIFEESSNDTVLYSNSKSTVYKKPDGKVNVRLNLSNDEREKLNGYLKKHTVSLKDLEKAANEDASFDLEDEMNVYDESNKETKAKNRETTKRVLDRDYSPEGKYDNMGLYLKYPSTTRNVERDNPHAVMTKNGKVSRISSLHYNKAGFNNNRITHPYRDDLDKMMSVNKSKNKTVMKDLKDKLNDAKETRKRIALSGLRDKYYKSRLPK